MLTTTTTTTTTTTGGEMKRMIEDYHNIDIDLSRNNELYLYGNSDSDVIGASSLVLDLISEITIGSIIQAKVIKVHDFGCVVHLTRGQVRA